jgi:hypothetical protein
VLVKLIEVTKDIGGVNRLREVYVNSSHIISVSEDTSSEPLIKESLGLSENVRFSFVLVSEGNKSRRLTVVGTPSEINNKVKKRQVLRG